MRATNRTTRRSSKLEEFTEPPSTDTDDEVDENEDGRSWGLIVFNWLISVLGTFNSSTCNWGTRSRGAFKSLVG